MGLRIILFVILGFALGLILGSYIGVNLLGALGINQGRGYDVIGKITAAIGAVFLPYVGVYLPRKRKGKLKIKK